MDGDAIFKRLQEEVGYELTELSPLTTVPKMTSFSHPINNPNVRNAQMAGGDCLSLGRNENQYPLLAPASLSSYSIEKSISTDLLSLELQPLSPLATLLPYINSFTREEKVADKELSPPPSPLKYTNLEVPSPSNRPYTDDLMGLEPLTPLTNLQPYIHNMASRETSSLSSTSLIDMDADRELTKQMSSPLRSEASSPPSPSTPAADRNQQLAMGDQPIPQSATQQFSVLTPMARVGPGYFVPPYGAAPRYPLIGALVYPTGLYYNYVPAVPLARPVGPEEESSKPLKPLSEYWRYNKSGRGKYDLTRRSEEERRMRDFLADRGFTACPYGCGKTVAGTNKRVHIKKYHYDVYYKFRNGTRSAVEELRVCTLGPPKGDRICLYCHVNAADPEEMENHLMAYHRSVHAKFVIQLRAAGMKREKRCMEGRE